MLPNISNGQSKCNQCIFSPSTNIPEITISIHFDAVEIQNKFDSAEILTIIAYEDI